MTITKARYQLFELAGLILLDLSLILAFRYSFTHFYEVLVLGLFLIFYALDRRYMFTPDYVRMYMKFIKIGIIFDLVIGLTITKLWTYNYATVLEYIPLYLVVYPVAGIVMVQTYVFFNHKIKNRGKKRYFLGPNTYRSLFIGVTTILLFLISLIIGGNTTTFVRSMFFLAVCIDALLLLSYASRSARHHNILDELHSNPARILLVIILAAFLNALLHEIPNTVANQWTYNNWLLQEVTLFGIPILVSVGWVFMTVIPVAIYYTISSKKKV